MKEEVRKIQLVGNRSFSITLPKSWIKNNKISAGMQVILERTPADHLIIKQFKEKKERTALEVHFNKILNVKTFLNFCYEKNITLIKIIGDYNSGITNIKKAIKKLEGYEISEETEKSIEISFLFDEVNISIQKIIRRMLYSLKLMTESENKEELENNIDKFYSLSKRILFSCQIDPVKREKNEIDFPEEVIWYWNICKKIEGLADIFEERDSKKFTELISDIQNAWQKKFVSQDVVQKWREKLKKDRDVRDLASDLFESILFIHLNKDFPNV